MSDIDLIADRMRSLLDVTEIELNNETAVEIWEEMEDLSANSNITVEDLGTIVKQKLPEIDFEEVTFAADNSDLDAVLNDLKGRPK